MYQTSTPGLHQVELEELKFISVISRVSDSAVSYDLIIIFGSNSTDSALHYDRNASMTTLHYDDRKDMIVLIHCTVIATSLFRDRLESANEKGTFLSTFPVKTRSRDIITNLHCAVIVAIIVENCTALRSQRGLAVHNCVQPHVRHSRTLWTQQRWRLQVITVPIPGNILSNPSKPESNSEQHTSEWRSMFDKSTSSWRWFSKKVNYTIRKDGLPVFPKFKRSKKRALTSFIRVEFLGDHAGKSSRFNKIDVPFEVFTRVFFAIWNMHGAEPAFRLFQDANLESLPIYFMNEYKTQETQPESFRIKYWTDEHKRDAISKRKYLKVDLGCTSEKPCEGLIDKNGRFIEHKIVGREVEEKKDS
ncbi:hypothetical protein EV360DRAFT_70317 [Lentinula raphanica]|nr:hypothetical protein EV360DRAFT_70317 [Lentinula raphanica]